MAPAPIRLTLAFRNARFCGRNRGDPARAFPGATPGHLCVIRTNHVLSKPILSTTDQAYLLDTGQRETADADPKTFDPPSGGPPQQETMMKNLILAAIATLGLGIGVAAAAPANNTPWHLGSQNVPAYGFGGDGA
jgi:hypothetical protein